MSGHKSDCAVHNAPAYSPGKCDCGFDEHLRIAKSYVGEDYDIVPKSQNGDDDYWFHKYEALSNKYWDLSASNAELLEALRPIAHIARNVVPKTQSRRDDDGYEIVVTVGNLRRIHAAYIEIKGTD